MNDAKKEDRKPIPVRFNPAEEKLLNQLKEKTGMNKSELIRRCVRLLGREVKRRNQTDFIAGLTSVELDGDEPEAK